MANNDLEYRVTRYWRDTFKRAHDEGDVDPNLTDKLRKAIIDSYVGMQQTLDEELAEYLQKTGKRDEDFPEWQPE